MYNKRDVRVLIAEDDYLVSRVVKGLLEKAGYTVVGEAIDGVQAVEMVQSLQPDVVLMDIEMPGLNGIEATRLICQHCPTPVVALTAYESAELVREASEAGVGAYLVKPPRLREVERAITIAMARFDDMMELRRLNADLQVRNEELGAFAHTVAHDIKSPLSLIVGFAEILIEDYMISAQDRRLYLNRMVKSGRKISNIVDELLVLAGVRQMEVQMSPLDMAEIVADAQRRLSSLIKEQQAEIVLPPAWPSASGYGPWIEEVWVNYLSNAVKYGGRPDEGIPPHIELGFEEQPNSQIRFWVRDNGTGIPAEAQERLFTPFVRLDQVHVRGYGLGLSIARRIVEKLGGQVGVESSVGQGSTFSFTLPAAGDEENGA